ncbi:hypothetical protein [Hugenholtzia roseola]|uniref:hypothetical protein n=1 Tax=Hugenholtzia roseola TaxID=1002 RepID=UPI00047E96A7|nr:hypothetical protein [Hugenholtzia roseola]
MDETPIPQPAHNFSAPSEIQQHLSQIKRLKEKIQTTQRDLDQTNQLVKTQLLPIIERVAEQKEALLDILIQMAESKRLPTSERQYLHNIICAKAEELIFRYGRVEAVPIYRKYQSQIKPKNKKEATLFEKLNQKFEETISQLFEDDAPKRAQQEAFSERKQSRRPTQETDPETDKETDKEADQAGYKIGEKVGDQAQAAQQLMRKIYTQLAKSLHPDKELDAERKKEKNDLMHALTQAYQKQDLFVLLEMQQKYGDWAQQNTTPDAAERDPQKEMDLLLQLLKTQRKNLEGELLNLTQEGASGALYQEFGTNPKEVKRNIRQKKEELVAELLKMKEEIMAASEYHQLL